MRRVRIGVLASAALVLVLVASSCVLSGTWRATTPEQTWTATQMSDVSCLAPDDCYGLAYDLMGPMALQHWDGTEWDHVATATGLRPIDGVDLECWAADGCMALTRAWEEFTDPTQAAIWNGSTFRGYESKDLGMYGPQLECFSAAWCSTWSPQHRLNDMWTGSGWAVDHSLDTTSGITGTGDCVGPTQCVVVSSPAGTAEHIQGTTHTVVPFPTGLEIWKVSCVSTSWCVAAGRNGSATWDGTTWTARPLDLGAAGISDFLLDCAGVNACLAVARRPLGGGNIQLIAKAMYGGTTWADAPAIPATVKFVTDLECPAGGKVCYLAGGSDESTVAGTVMIYDWNAPT